MAFKYEPFVGQQVYGKYNKVIASRKDRLGFLTLNNPMEGNLLDLDMMEEVVSAVREIEADDKVLVIIINAAGRDYSLGIDYRKIPANGEEAARFFEKFVAHAVAFSALSKPLISSVHGRAYAGGCALAVRTPDLAVLAEDARIALAGMTLGLTCAAGFKATSRIVGPLKAKEYILTGRDIDPHEVVSLGMANKVVPLEKLNDATIEFAELIASRPPNAIKASKKVFNETYNMTPVEAWNYGLQKCVAPLTDTEDFKIAVDAIFTEDFIKGGKTPLPKWKGR